MVKLLCGMSPQQPLQSHQSSVEAKQLHRFFRFSKAFLILSTMSSEHDPGVAHEAQQPTLLWADVLETVSLSKTGA